MFFASVFCGGFVFILILRLTRGLPFLGNNDSFYGLAFFVLAVLLLFKIGFFNLLRIPKVIGLLLYLYLVQLAAALITERSLQLALTPVLFVTMFMVILYILYHKEIVVYLKEPKPVLDLKDIAFEHGVSESTIRNTLARTYKKLGVKDKSELRALTALHTLKYGDSVH